MWITLALVCSIALLGYAVICFGFAKPQSSYRPSFAVEQFVNTLPKDVRNRFSTDENCVQRLREEGLKSGFILELDWRGTFSLIELMEFVHAQHQMVLPYQKSQQFMEANSVSPGTSGNYTINLLRCFDQDLALGNLRIVLWDSASPNYLLSIFKMEEACDWVKKHPEMFHTVHQLKL